MRDEILKALDGIDRDAIDNGGWWEISAGVEIGTEALKRVLAVFDAQAARIADLELARERIADLEAALAQAEADVQRYRWLRDCSSENAARIFSASDVRTDHDGGIFAALSGMFSGPSMDRAIDAARAASGEVNRG